MIRQLFRDELTHHSGLKPTIQVLKSTIQDRNQHIRLSSIIIIPILKTTEIGSTIIFDEETGTYFFVFVFTDSEVKTKKYGV